MKPGKQEMKDCFCVRISLSKKIIFGKILFRLFMIALIVTLSIKFKIDYGYYLESLIVLINDYFGKILSPIIFLFLSSFWCSISPMGYLPTILCGIFFPIYISCFISYISVNIGSYLNILLIRYIILNKQIKCCIFCCQCMFGKKMGRFTYLESLIENDAIQVVILTRLPYLHNGLLNYIYSLSSINIMDCVKGNLIGFIPGSIIFSIFGREMKSIINIINNGFDNYTQIILFISLTLLAIICYVFIAYKVKKILNKKRNKNNNNDMHHESSQEMLTINSPDGLNTEGINADEGNKDPNETIYTFTNDTKYTRAKSITCTPTNDTHTSFDIN